MKIPVSSNYDKFFKQLVGLLSNFVPIKGLRRKTKEVLAEILYQNYLLRKHSEEERLLLIFTTHNRREMAKKLGVSEDNLNVLLSELRKQRVLTKDNKLPKFLSSILPKDSFEFTIYFNLK